jgi:hypothetical protein
MQGIVASMTRESFHDEAKANERPMIMAASAYETRHKQQRDEDGTNIEPNLKLQAHGGARQR